MDTMPKPDLDMRVCFTPRWSGVEAAARVRVWRDERVVVVTELDDNPGASVTNGAEDLAHTIEAALSREQVVLAPGLGGTPYTLVEHYEPNHHRAASIDYVRFGRRAGDGRPRYPTWRAVPAEGEHSWLHAALR